MGANAILMMRFDSAEIGNTMSESGLFRVMILYAPLPMWRRSPGTASL
jgi:hypothetical protein